MTGMANLIAQFIVLMVLIKYSEVTTFVIFFLFRDLRAVFRTLSEGGVSK